MNVHCVEILSILTNTETGHENQKPVTIFSIKMIWSNVALTLKC